MSAEQPFAAGTKVKFKSSSCYARRWPGTYVVEGSDDHHALTYIEGEYLGFQTSHLEAASTQPSTASTPTQPATASAAAPVPAPAAHHTPQQPTKDPAMQQTNTLGDTSKTQPPASAVQSVDGWRAEFRASPALQAEYLTEDSYVATRKFDAKRAGVKFNGFSAAEADQQTDPHIAAWMRDPALQAEFLTPQAYSAFKRAEERGSAKILRRPGA